jgi:two-component system, OmpR family, phosphate regulon sensor histidine kinase PhoR
MTSRPLKTLGWMAVILLLFAVVFSATFFLTSFLYQYIAPPRPAFLVQTINGLLGLVLGGLILAGVGATFGAGHRAREIQVFGPVIEALEKIATGNFDVRLTDDFGRHPILGDLATSVNKMASDLGRVEQMRREFIANVSHEIQSPLTSIRGFAQALRDDDLILADRHHYLTIIETESTRLSRLTDNLLRLASLESAQVTFEPKPFRLDKQLRRLILACEPQWAAKSIELEVSLEEVAVTGDEDLLSQVWLNLLHNSIKFTPEGGRICVALERQGEAVACRVADSGIGIPAEDQARVFERFYKADKARERSKEGSGLGLAIAQRIVELHHGTIMLESAPGAGSAFTVSLPAP